jgi:multidrug efflux pump
MATGLDARAATIKAMDEITGPVLAITLVLGAVFIPCAFLGGITGQFFRQFAVTIAVSTFISAINALTMTPSRAVLIFQGSGVRGQESGNLAPEKEALPWWIFGILGGLGTVWLFPRLLPELGVSEFVVVNWAENWVTLDLDPWHEQVGEVNEVDAWLRWLTTGGYFLPGLLVGLTIGWSAIGPINAVLGWVFRGFNRIFDRMTEVYGVAVGKVLRVSAIVCIGYGGLLILTGVQFALAPTGFIPQQDKGYLILNVQLPDAASVERTEKVMAYIDKLLRGDKNDLKKHPGVPGVAHAVGVSGQSIILNANAPNLGSMYVMLEPFEKRHAAEKSADEIAEHIRELCEREVQGAIVAVFGGPPVDGLGATGGFKIMIEDRGNLGQKELQRICDNIVRRGNRTDGLVGLGHSSRANTPWLYLEIDRDSAKVHGVEIKDIFDTLQVYLGSYYVNNFNAFGRTWQVNVQADQKYRNKVTDIRQLQVRNSQGQMVRLGTFIDVRDTVGPVMLMNYNMYASIAITGNADDGTSSGQAIELVQALADKELPRSMAYEWTELTHLQLQAGNVAIFFFTLAVVFVFLVLAAQYESWSLPLAVILVVPMCLLCSISGIMAASMEVNIFTQIGFVVLVGLASKNAILIVEFAKTRREEGVGAREATIEASRLRLRPILMTSFAFILGVVPLVLAKGAGAEMRRSLGLAVFTGMCGVTLFGVFLTPVFYYVVQWFAPKEPTRP